MTDHTLTMDEDEAGWPIVTCSCGASSGPLPGKEIAAEVWGEHYAAAVVAERSGPVLFEGTAIGAADWFWRGECRWQRRVRVVAIDQETD